jgi:hypothetical protein
MVAEIIHRDGRRESAEAAESDAQDYHDTSMSALILKSHKTTRIGGRFGEAILSAHADRHFLFWSVGSCIKHFPLHTP